MLLDYLEERCRICLEKTESHFSLHKKVPIDEDNIFVSEILRYCGKIEVLQEDRKPQNVCSVCIENAKVSYKFKLACMQSETILNTQILYNMINRRSPLEFKKEDDRIDIRDEEISNIKEEETNLNNAEVGSEDGEEGDDTFNDYDNAEREENSDCFEESDEQQESNNCTENTNVVLKNAEKTKTKIYKCPYCDFTALNTRRLGWHMTKKHDEKKTQKCHNCGKRFFKKDNLISHMRTHTKMKNHVCKECGKRFAKMRSLNIHRRLHTGEKQHKCSTCGNASSLFSVLQKMLADRGKENHNISEQQNLNSGSAKRDEIVRSEEQGEKCPYCDFTARNAHRLGLHMNQKHDDKKILECHNCGKRFFKKDNLISHMRTHTKVKPHVCKVCGKCFARKSNFSRHCRVHTGEKPYKCSTCKKAFGSSFSLLRHKRRLIHGDTDEEIHDVRKQQYLKNVKVDSDRMQDEKLGNAKVGSEEQGESNDCFDAVQKENSNCFEDDEQEESNNALENNDNNVENAGKHKCPHCNKSFKHLSQLKLHERSYTRRSARIHCTSIDFKTRRIRNGT